MTKKLMHKNLILVFTAIFSVLMISACTTTGTRKSESPTTADYDLQPAEFYLQQAEAAEEADKAPFLLQAAKAHMQREQYAEAYEVLNSFYPTQLPLNLRADWYLLVGEVALIQEQPFDSIRALQSVRNPEKYDTKWQSRYYRLLADSLAANQRHADAAMTRIEAMHLFQDEKLREEQERKTWLELMTSPTGALEITRNRANKHNELGWLDMAIIQQQFSNDQAALSNAMQEWNVLYPNHPALFYINLKVEREAVVVDFGAPTKIGLFLPTSGRLATVGNVILDGFMTSFYDTQMMGSEKPEVVVYDTASEPIELLYQQALADGVEFVIGPLLKNRADDIAQYQKLPIPTLVLNRLDKAYTPSGMFQFGLPVEDEAEQIAEYAINKGQTRAFIINADKSVGARAVESFSDTFQRLGGDVVRTADLSRTPDPKIAVMQMLGADQAERRKRELQNLLNLPIESSAQISATADFIFMIAAAKDARIIKPYLNYYYAYNLPVYATSSLYDGGKERENDLNGIQFTDAPWMIPQSEEQASNKQKIVRMFPNAGGTLGRFFALGYDSFLLIPEIPQLSALSDYSVQGLSGELTLDYYGRIVRQLAWAKYRNGHWVPLTE
ncbi:penicillin-binding protein activator [Kangiella koreensis]|uniref:LppC family lipoprotein n=1 Tax=Kangiella koreensis (strain DSM 16069 / JCM 12317 / KCTC 12182 / SW-125) TaxID=523791 RepID=C7R9K4_KANKD|nr:penicillin-binding protein activator [Kangiella koreensis]ACV26095.1 LppC family lipoprotein [Kangiella koreensis DSM 16069]